MGENVRDILGKYGVNDARSMPEHKAKALAFEMVLLASNQNRKGENHIAVGALTHAVLALATAMPDPSDEDVDYRRRWGSLQKWLQECCASYKRLAKTHGEDADFVMAAMYEQRALAFAQVIRTMGEEPAEDGGETTLDIMSFVRGSVQDHPAGGGTDRGPADHDR